MSVDEQAPRDISSDKPEVRADLRDIDEHASWRQVRRAMHLTGEGGHD